MLSELDQQTTKFVVKLWIVRLAGDCSRQIFGGVKRESTAAGSAGDLKSRLEIPGLLDNAFQHLYAGRFAKAEELCRIINAADPNQPGSSYILGLIAHQRGQLDQAIGLMKRVIALKPTEARAYNNLGVMLCQTGNVVEGMAAYEQAIALSPDYAAAHNNLGGAYTNTNMPEEAVAQCQIALRLHPEFAEAHYYTISAVPFTDKGSQSRLSRTSREP